MDLIHALVLATIFTPFIIIVGLTVTWYFQDSGPIFGPTNAEGRVTFKQVLLHFYNDVVELTGLRVFFKWFAPRLRNPHLYAWVSTVLAGIGADPMTLMRENPTSFLALVAGIVFVGAVLKPFDAVPPSAAAVPDPGFTGVNPHGGPNAQVAGAS